MSDIFNEANMRHILQKYVFSGETLVTGIHAVSHETEIRGVFGKCTCTENSLILDEDGSVIVLNKKNTLLMISISALQNSLWSSLIVNNAVICMNLKTGQMLMQ